MASSQLVELFPLQNTVHRAYHHAVYTTIAPKPLNAPSHPSKTLASLGSISTSNIHPDLHPAQSLPDHITTDSATPPPLNTTPPSQKTASVPNAALPSSALSSGVTTQRSISMVQHDKAEDSPVLNETLSVIDEHMTDMHNPRPAIHERHHTNDSGSEYSSFLDHRISYIAGQETDEEENNAFTEREVVSWTPQQVAEHLEDMGVEARHCDVFREQDISGEVLLAMDQATIFMKEFNLGLVGQRLRTWHKVKALQDEVRTMASPQQRQKAVFMGDNGFLNASPQEEMKTMSRGRRSRLGRASTNPIPLPQDMADAQPSPSFSSTQRQSRDSNSLQSSFAFRSTLDSPSRPSAASIRELNHSRRHSAADQGSPGLPHMPSPRPESQSAHKKTPSLDQSWNMGSPPLSAGSRPRSSLNIGGSSAEHPSPRLPSQRASHVPQGSQDLDRGYKSGDELDSRRARNVLRKRDLLGTSHSRQSSYQADTKGVNGGNRRHSRFGSVDSIKDTVAAITHPNSKSFSGGQRSHMRNSSAGEAIVKPATPSNETGTPAVTTLEYSHRPSMKIITSPFNRDSGISLSSSPKSSSSRAGNKPRVGLRAISDAVTGNEKTVVTSPTAVSTPRKDSSRQSPSRTGSTTPSGASQSLDRESTDASSKGTNATQPTKTPIPGPRRKGKKETSAYIRGLEQKTPQEQMIDCDYSGWMKKKSSNMMTTWKQRLFVLRGRRLSYYYTEDDDSEKGLIDISSHRVLPADHDLLTGIHAAVTGAKSSPISPPTAHTPTLAATEAAQQTESSLQKTVVDSTFIFKLVPPRSGLTRAVNFTKPTVHYFAVDNVRQGRLWMAALMKATIDRDETKPITTSYQLRTISLAKARMMKQRPPALRDLEEQGETVGDGPKSDETGLNIQGLDLKQNGSLNQRTSSLDSMSKTASGTTDEQQSEENKT